MAVANLALRVDSRDAKKATSDLGGLSAAAGKAGKAAGALAVAFTGIMSGGAIIREIAAFDSEMSKVSAITRATASELSSMRDVARDLGTSTEFSAKQAASGLSFLGMAGFDAAESIASIPAVLDLATASAMDLGAAADITSNIMSGFGIAATDATSVTDILAAASSRANTDVGQLGQAMSTVAPISKALGIDLADTAASIGIMSDAGIQGARAGTALRGVLASLAGPTDEAVKVLTSLGLSVEDVNPELDSMSNIMGKLQRAEISTADAMTFFGREAASGALVLIESSSKLKEFGAELRNVDGEAMRMAETMRDHLGGDISGLQSAVSGLMLSLGEAGLTAILRVVVKLVTEVARGMSYLVDRLADMSSFIAGMVNLGGATDNLTLAMGDQISQANALFAIMGQGSTMTQSAALATLSDAEARLRDAEATREQVEARSALQLLELQTNYERQNEALKVLQEGTDAYHDRQDSLVDIIGKMDAIRAIQSSTNVEFDAARAEVERIRSAIKNAVDGMVSFDGEVVTAKELSERLSLTLGNMNVDSAISGVNFLANDLGVTLEVANKLNAALDAAAGIRAHVKPTGGDRGLSYGLGATDVDVSANSLSFGPTSTTSSNPTNIAGYKSPVADLSGLTGGGRSGSRSSGGGKSESQREAERTYNESISERDKILEGLKTEQDKYNDALAQAKRLMDAEVLSVDAYTQHVAQLNEELKDSQFGPLRDEIDSFTDALFDGQDAVKDYVKNAILEFAKLQFSQGLQGLLGIGGSVGGATGGGLLSVLGSLLSFDGGGSTGSGSRSGGVDGKGGFPAILHPNETVIDHTKNNRGYSGGAMAVSVSVDNNGNFQAMVRNEAGKIVASTASAIVSQSVAASSRAAKSTKGFFS